MGQTNAKYALPDDLRLILTQNTHYDEKQLGDMYKEFCKALKGEVGVKTQAQFLEVAPAFHLFDVLTGLKFFDLTPAGPQLNRQLSQRAAAGSADFSSQGLASPTSLEHPDVRAYWSDLFFYVFDSNSDGTVDFEEFATVLYKLSSSEVQEKAHFVFDVINKNNDNVVSKQELYELHDLLFRGFKASFLLTVSEQLQSNPKLANLPADEVQHLMKIVSKRVDKLAIPTLLSDNALKLANRNSDGQLTFDEFFFFVTDTKTRRTSEKTAVELVGPLLDRLLVETVDLIKHHFSKLLSTSASTPRQTS